MTGQAYCAICGNEYSKERRHQIACRKCFKENYVGAVKWQYAYNRPSCWVYLFSRGRSTEGIPRTLAKMLLLKIHEDIVGPNGKEASQLILANME